MKNKNILVGIMRGTKYALKKGGKTLLMTAGGIALASFTGAIINSVEKSFVSSQNELSRDIGKDMYKDLFKDINEQSKED